MVARAARALEDQQPRRVPGLGGLLGDALRRQGVVEEVELAHGALPVPAAGGGAAAAAGAAAGGRGGGDRRDERLAQRRHLAERVPGEQRHAEGRARLDEPGLRHRPRRLALEEPAAEAHPDAPCLGQAAELGHLVAEQALVGGVEHGHRHVEVPRLEPAAPVLEQALVGALVVGIDGGRELHARPRGARARGDAPDQRRELLAAPGVEAVGVLAPLREGRREARLGLEAGARLGPVTEGESDTEACPRQIRQHVGEADVVEVQPVEAGVAAQQLLEGGRQAFGDPGRGGIEVDGGRPDPVALRLGRRDVVARVVEERAAPLVDEHRAGPEVAQQGRAGVRREGEHVHPGVHAQARPVGAFDEGSERVGARRLGGAPGGLPGRAVGEGRVEPGAPAPVHLDEEIGDAERLRVFEKQGQPVGALEHPLGSLAEHPETPVRPRRRRG